jgi:multidrug resistance protein
MTIFIDITGYGVVIPLLPFLAASLRAGSTALGVLIASFAVMQFFFAPVMGRLSDRLGRKPVLMMSISVSTFSFFLFALADSFLILLLSRIVAGIATETAVAQAYVADITKKEERAATMGRLGAAFGVGFIVGPAIGGVLSVFGFWAPGVAAVALTLVNLLFVFFFLPESIRTKGGSGQRQFHGGASYVSGLRNVLSRPLIGPTLGIVFLTILAFSAIPVVAPLVGITFFGWKAVEMSYVFIYIGAVQIVLQGFLFGKIAKKFGEERLIAFGPLLMAAGMLTMPLFSNVAAFLAAITMIAMGIGVLDAATPSFISKRTPKGEQGGVLGVSQSVSSVARVPGPLIGGFAFEFAGILSPFLLSVGMLIVAFALGCRVFQACSRSPPA